MEISRDATNDSLGQAGSIGAYPFKYCGLMMIAANRSCYFILFYSSFLMKRTGGMNGFGEEWTFWRYDLFFWKFLWMG
ncbi:hypothetical protein BDW42DRAFT_168484 [Aspergillus taichungensis]|uniref:Uncharacterized protein n=1 Tax=Aspergillus taichungensis TaxID=482145 RepID=A0A2J5HWC1_9EURO|nr:hypothetical protein BDW42DRAFT_168484 [Aspergillus taichungensis]